MTIAEDTEQQQQEANGEEVPQNQSEKETWQQQEAATSDAHEAPEEPPRRVIGRPFKPGNRANPGGRPKGSRDGAWLMRQTLKALGTREETVTWLKEQMQKRPATYLQFLNRLLPTSGTLQHGVDPELSLLESIRQAAEDRRRELLGLQPEVRRLPVEGLDDLPVIDAHAEPVPVERRQADDDPPANVR